MNTHEDRLRALLEEVVADVEPREALPGIRAATHTRTRATRRRRSSWLWIGGAAVGTASVITAVAVLGSGQPASQAPPVTSPSATESATQSAAPTPKHMNPVSMEVPVYFLGTGPSGSRLFQETHQVRVAAALVAAVREAVEAGPSDPDYRTPWTGLTTVEAVNFDGIGAQGEFTIVFSTAPERPASMSDEEARLAVQQLVHTVQDAAGAPAPVSFATRSGPLDNVLGVDTSRPVTAAPFFETMSLMNITSPSEGATLSGPFTAKGLNNGFEASVACSIMDGDKELWSGSTTAAGSADEQLYPWKLTVDTQGIPPGTYTFVCSNDDPSGGAEGNGPATDTKTITIR